MQQSAKTRYCLFRRAVLPCMSFFIQELNDCEIFVVIGSSGAVINTDNFATYTHFSILNNLEPSHYIDEAHYDEIIYAKATEAIDDIIHAV